MWKLKPLKKRRNRYQTIKRVEKYLQRRMDYRSRLRQFKTINRDLMLNIMHRCGFSGKMMNRCLLIHYKQNLIITSQTRSGKFPKPVTTAIAMIQVGDNQTRLSL